MHHPESETVRTRSPHREVRRIPVGTTPDLAALVPALGLVPGVDSFVLLDGDGWDTRMLAFDPERLLSVKVTFHSRGYVASLPPRNALEGASRVTQLRARRSSATSPTTRPAAWSASPTWRRTTCGYRLLDSSCPGA